MRLKLLFALTALTLYSACNCPPDEETGVLELSAAAKTFAPYDGRDTLTFIGENGERYTLTLPDGEVSATDQICVRTICTEARFGSPSSCAYFSAESRRYTYRSNDGQAVLDILLYSALHKRNTEDFFDALNIGWSAGTGSTLAGWVIEKRFPGELDPGNTGIANFFTPRDTILLNGRLFTNILAWEEDELAVYFQAGLGPVGLRAAGKTWARE